MADISTSSSLAISKGAIADAFSNSGAITLSGTNYIKTTQSISTAATAINLGALASIGEFLIVNKDAVNFVDILSSTAGTTFLHILPGQDARGHFASTITAPAAKANTGSVQIAFMIAEN